MSGLFYDPALMTTPTGIGNTYFFQKKIVPVSYGDRRKIQGMPILP